MTGHTQHRPGRAKPWRARYRGPDGVERSRSFRRKVDAQRWLSEQLASRDRGEWVDPGLGRITIGAWAASWQAARVNVRNSTSARDESIIRNHLVPFLGPTPLAKLRPEDVRAWIARLSASGLAPATVAKAHQILYSMLEQAVADGRLGRNPSKRIDLPRSDLHEMRFLTLEEVDRLAAAIDPRYRVLVLTAAHSGLRWGELAGLKKDRLQKLQRSVLVTHAMTEVNGHLALDEPKTPASRRRVALPPFLAEELGKHLATYPDPDGWVFSAPRGGPLRRTTWRQRFWEPAVREAGLEPLTFHDLRHTHVALLIAAGEHAKTIQARLGHASITTTLDTYGHLLEGLDEGAASRLDQMWKARPETDGNIPIVVELDRGVAHTRP